MGIISRTPNGVEVSIGCPLQRTLINHEVAPLCLLLYSSKTTYFVHTLLALKILIVTALIGTYLRAHARPNHFRYLKEAKESGNGAIMGNIVEVFQLLRVQ
jgi:hypothetical protein